jgi:uracil-DNA glycosylase
MCWNKFIARQAQMPYYQNLQQFLQDQKDLGKIIFPPQALCFHAMDLAPLENIKVVILGQDPYHGDNQAHGLSFSVPDGVKIPPSLRNIYKELARSLPDYTMPESGNLTHWAKQGVLLLNSVLTVEKGHAGSHASKGWETFTDNIISEINKHKRGVIFLLWGSYAHKKGRLIDTQRHTVLKSTHPSPLSAYRGFLGCDHFKQVNLLISQRGETRINW